MRRMIDRRMFLRSAVPAAAAAAVLPRFGAASTQKPDLEVTPLTDRLFLVRGGGGNVTVFHSPEGVLLVDGGSPEHSAQVLQLVRERTGNPNVHTLFNTHWHWEQTGSNHTLGRAGTRIIAHENTRLWLTTDVNVKWQKRVYPPLPKEALPNQTFYTNGSLTFGGEQIDYGHLPNAHTDGDIYVFFRNANVLVAGDVLAVGSYPILDYTTHGWIGGMANAAQTLAKLCDENTKVIPGMGPPQTRADLQAEHEMLSTVKTRMSQLLAQGMSAQDMIDAQPTRDYDAKWGDPTLFIRQVWHGISLRPQELGVNIV
jgi:cyclase